MAYYAQYENNNLIAIGQSSNPPLETIISEAEYNRLLTEIRAKAKWEDDVYNGTPIADVPPEWQEEIQQRVEQRKQWEAEQATQDISDEEIADAVEGIL